MIKLRDYQITCAEHATQLLDTRGIAYLAMQTRTGKTHTALYVAKLTRAKKVLFLTKKKAIKSIESDYADSGYEYQFTVTNYENIHKVDITCFDLIICDEAHCLGAYPVPSLRAKRLRTELINRKVIFLSGTPTPESYSQIFHQFWISRNSPFDKYRNFYQWAHDYVVVKKERRGLYEVNNYDNANKNDIEAVVNPYLITYTQEEAGFSCPVNDHFCEVDAPIIPGLIKHIFKNRIIELIDNNGTVSKSLAETPAALMNKMHQLSGGTLICENSTQIITEKKAEFIKERFSGKRIVIFYKYIGELLILKKWFPDATESPELFQIRQFDVFISQISSGREGIALHSADCIVMYAIDYSAVSYWQARARIQSLSRTAPAEIYWIFFKGSIEPKIYKAVNQKKNFTLSYYVKDGVI